jgi:hypothetical protein
MPKFDWFWFIAGVLFSMFVMPLISQMLGKAKGSSAAKKAV